jgi:hypothetical protein
VSCLAESWLKDLDLEVCSPQQRFLQVFCHSFCLPRVELVLCQRLVSGRYKDWRW